MSKIHFPIIIECKNRANTNYYTNDEIFNLIINTYVSIRIRKPAGSEKKVTGFV